MTTRRGEASWRYYDRLGTWQRYLAIKAIPKETKPQCPELTKRISRVMK